MPPKFSQYRNLALRAGRITRADHPNMPDGRVKHTFPLADVIDSGIDWVAGPHAIWKHSALRIRANEGTGQVHRMWFESRTGSPIPRGMFLLNKCEVPGCIYPECHYISRYSSPYVVFANHAELVPSVDPVCVPASTPLEARCGQR